MDEDAFLDEVALLWEEEGLFARDVDGQLVRMEKATENDYEQDVTLKIDGQEVTVKKAVPSTDSQGNIIFDQNGRTVPRLTTIYDAASELFVMEQGGTNPIPILCHQEHMKPAGVCRVCSVEVCRMKGDREVPGGKLLPACHHPVKPDMIVHTVDSPQSESSERMRRAVKLLGELLESDHLHKETEEQSVKNELQVLTERMGCEKNRFAPRERNERGSDNSSQLISVDHNSCILCNRCIRACTEVKENMVIGRTGKGYTATIGFDLNNKMSDSSCVSCGECMVSCPTDALTFRNPVISDWYKEELANPSNTEVTVEELKQHHLFRSISYKWLQWNVASVIRRTVKKGDVLCRLGEYGATAFILNKGKFGVWLKDDAAGQLIKTRKKRNFLQRIFGASPRIDNSNRQGKMPAGDPNFVMTSEDLIIGEMTCMSDQPRTGTIAALEDGEIYEIRRNVLYVLQRNAASREVLDQVYRQRALFSHLNKISLFAELSKEERFECVQYLKDRVQLLRVEPGQNIFRQGETAIDFYMIRLGHVKVHQTFLGQEQVLAYLRPDTHFGEIGLVSNFPELIDELREQEVPEYLWRRRTASCSALDDVELVRVSGRDFFELTKKFPALKN